jgi:hypothetical protein
LSVSMIARSSVSIQSNSCAISSFSYEQQSRFLRAFFAATIRSTELQAIPIVQRSRNCEFPTCTLHPEQISNANSTTTNAINNAFIPLRASAPLNRFT